MEAKSNAFSGLLRRIGSWFRSRFSVPRGEVREMALDGLLRRNPLLVLLLGLCPALGAATSLQNGIAMGAATAVVLVCSSLTCALLRPVIPAQIFPAVRLIAAAAFTGAIDLLIQALLPGLSQALGIYIPLIAVSGVVLCRGTAAGLLPGRAALDALFSGVGFTAALAVLGGARELLGAGTIWGHPLPLISSHPLRILLSPCGGFLLLGALTALVQFIKRRKGGAA